MSYNGTPINSSPTIVGAAKAAITNGAFRAVKFSSGEIAMCGVAGEASMGILMPETPASVAAGDDVSLQIKDIGLWMTGDAVAAGAELTTDANGKAITATSGAYILAQALEAAAAAGRVIRVQIIKAGYKGGGSVSPLTLAGLTDVDITSIQGGDAIVYDATAQKYVNKALALKDLSDVDPALAPTDGQALKYDGTTDNQWEATT